MNHSTLFDTLVVVKRSGQRTSFQGEKIALAIQKAFRSIDIPYKDEDVNKVYSKVLEKIEAEYQNRKTINIENIQDIIEEILQKQKFLDVFQAFSAYREQRNASRKAFVIKQQHKFLKAIESLGLHNSNENIKDYPSDLIKKFGSTISYEFAKAYLLDTKTTRNHDSGVLFLHSIETIPMGSIESIAIDLLELETLDTPFSKDLRSQVQITSYLELVEQMLFSLQQEVYGSITFCSFDQGLENIVFQQYKELLKDYLSLYFSTHELNFFLPYDKLEKEIDKMTDIFLPKDILSSYLKDSKLLLLSFDSIYQKALQKTEQILIEALSSFFCSLASFDIGFNFGTATSFFGRVALKAILQAKNKSDSICYFFQVKKGISYLSTDLNYCFLQKYHSLALHKKHCYYVFLDSCFNYIEGENVCYFPKGQRVLEDNTTLEKKLVGGKGNLATVSINLVRIALKHPLDLRGFYQELESVLSLSSEVLLERFNLECSKHSHHFPTLYGYGIWHDGEKLKPNERIRKILKHGTLTIHFCGLKEALMALIQKKEGEEAYQVGFEIVSFMQKKIAQLSENENLNFTLSAIEDENVEREFKKQDTAIFGKQKGITDQDKFSSGYSLKTNLSNLASFQQKTNGGHLEKIMVKDKEDLEKIFPKMVDDHFGCVLFSFKS